MRDNVGELALKNAKIRHQEPIIDDFDDKLLFEQEYRAWEFVVEESKESFIDGYRAAGGYTENDMIEFGRWIIQNSDFQHDSSWSKETAEYHLNEFKSIKEGNERK